MELQFRVNNDRELADLMRIRELKWERRIRRLAEEELNQERFAKRLVEELSNTWKFQIETEVVQHFKDFMEHLDELI